MFSGLNKKTGASQFNRTKLPPRALLNRLPIAKELINQDHQLNRETVLATRTALVDVMVIFRHHEVDRKEKLERALPFPTGIGEVNPRRGTDYVMPFQAGQLQQHCDLWKDLGAPPYILNIVTGYHIPFKAKPPLCLPNHRINQTAQSPEMDHVIQKLLDQHVIVPAPYTPSFVSTIFLRPKSDGSLRPIFNLKNLNKFVRADKFRLVHVHKVPDFLHHQDWMATIDTEGFSV